MFLLPQKKATRWCSLVGLISRILVFSMRYGGKVVDNTAAYVDNTLKAVTEHVEVLKKIIEESDDATWAAEEEKRSKK